MTYQKKLSVACVVCSGALWAVASFLQFKPWTYAALVFILGASAMTALFLALSVLFDGARRLDDRKKP